MSEDSDRLRELLAKIGMGQREAARMLDVDEREFLKMAAGTREVPQVVLLALELVARKSTEEK